MCNFVKWQVLQKHCVIINPEFINRNLNKSSKFASWWIGSGVDRGKKKRWWCFSVAHLKHDALLRVQCILMEVEMKEPWLYQGKARASSKHRAEHWEVVSLGDLVLRAPFRASHSRGENNNYCHLWATRVKAPGINSKAKTKLIVMPGLRKKTKLWCQTNQHCPRWHGLIKTVVAVLPL